MKFINKTLKKSNCLIPSKALIEKDFYLDISKKIHIIPESIELLPSIDEKQEENYILIPAFISRLKGIEYIIKSLLYVDDKNINVNIVGGIIDNDYFLELKETIKIMNIEERVKFMNIQMIWILCIEIVKWFAIHLYLTMVVLKLLVEPLLKPGLMKNQ
jgi:glycosyltransferase involved in cell wall biosynthesis